jgi:hypothetical protein
MNIGKIKERLLKIQDDLEIGLEDRRLFFESAELDWQVDDFGIEYQKITEGLEEAKVLIFKSIELFN